MIFRRYLDMQKNIDRSYLAMQRLALAILPDQFGSFKNVVVNFEKLRTIPSQKVSLSCCVMHDLYTAYTHHDVCN